MRQSISASAGTAQRESATLFGLRLRMRWRRYLPLAFGLVILLPFLLFALFPDFFAPYDPVKTSIRSRFTPPSREHWFGTDELGRDVYSRVVYGARLSMGTGLLTIVFASVIGVAAGVIAGYWGGSLDRVIMSVVDMVLAFPTIILAMAVAAALGPSLLHSMMAVAAVWWPVYARLMRGLTLRLKHEAYVEASQAIGGNPTHIIVRHIVPNALSALNVRISLDIGYPDPGESGFHRTRGQRADPGMGRADRVGAQLLPDGVVDRGLSGNRHHPRGGGDDLRGRRLE